MQSTASAAASAIASGIGTFFLSGLGTTTSLALETGACSCAPLSASCSLVPARLVRLGNAPTFTRYMLLNVLLKVDVNTNKYGRMCPAGAGILRVGLGLVHLAVQFLVFASVLYYLLALEIDPIQRVVGILPLSPEVGRNFR